MTRARAAWPLRLGLVSLLLAAYVTQSGDFGATYGPLTGVMALLLWANLTGIALFLGIAFAAQLEARRIGFSEPAMADKDTSLEERSETTLTGGTRQRLSGGY